MAWIEWTYLCTNACLGVLRMFDTPDWGGGRIRPIGTAPVAAVSPTPNKLVGVIFIIFNGSVINNSVDKRNKRSKHSDDYMARMNVASGISFLPFFAFPFLGFGK